MTYHPQDPWTEQIHNNFCAEVVKLFDAINMEAVTTDELCDVLAKHVAAELQPCGEINQDGAKRHFAHYIHTINTNPDKCRHWNMPSGSPFNRKEAIAVCVTRYAEECATDVRWPIAYAYVVTGQVPNHYARNTTVTVVAEDEQGKVVGQEVIHWADYATIEDEAKCYGKFHSDIRDAAIRLKARSLYEFMCDAKPRSRMAIRSGPHDGEVTTFHEHRYRDSSDAVDPTGPAQ